MSSIKIAVCHAFEISLVTSSVRLRRVLLTHLALNISDKQLHVIRPLIFIRSSRSSSHSLRKLLRPRHSAKHTRPSRPTRHAHMEAIRHSSTSTIKRPLVILQLERRCIRPRRCRRYRRTHERGHRSTQAQMRQCTGHGTPRSVSTRTQRRIIIRRRVVVIMMMTSFPFPVDQCEIEVQPIGQGRGTFRTSCVGTDNDPFPPTFDFGLDVPDHGHLGQEVITRNIKEPLDLGSVKVHGDDVVTTSNSQEVGNESTQTDRTRNNQLLTPRFT